MSLLQVRNLVVEFPGRRGTLRALDDISFDIAPGESWVWWVNPARASR
jgi:peptide/nickel transport system ATP-binding protein